MALFTVAITVTLGAPLAQLASLYRLGSWTPVAMAAKNTGDNAQYKGRAQAKKTTRSLNGKGTIQNIKNFAHNLRHEGNIYLKKTGQTQNAYVILSALAAAPAKKLSQETIGRVIENLDSSKWPAEIKGGGWVNLLTDLGLTEKYINGDVGLSSGGQAFLEEHAMAPLSK